MDQLIAEDGEVLHVKVLGSGRPLVVLHGWTGSHREWMYVARQLADRAQSYCWDARGHSLGATRDAAAVTLARMADDLNLLLRHYRLRAPLLVGHSMGALTIWQYLRQHGAGDLGGLCLIDQSPRLITGADWHLGLYGDFDEAAARAFSSALAKDFPGGVLRFLGYDQVPTDAWDAEDGSESIGLLRDYLSSLDSTALIACWDSLITADFRDLLATIELPTLLVFGDRSRFYTTDVARYVHQHIEHSVLKVYVGADHSPQLSCADLLVRDLSDFIDTLTSDTSH